MNKRFIVLAMIVLAANAEFVDLWTKLSSIKTMDEWMDWDTAVTTESNDSHYGDPKSGCQSDEMVADGAEGNVPGKWCSPQCQGNQCPSDTPSGSSAEPGPSCGWKDNATGTPYCMLACNTDAWFNDGCGKATCRPIGPNGASFLDQAGNIVKGICTYDQ